MASEQAENKVDPPTEGVFAPADGGKKKNEVSTIGFPYNDLEAAIVIVKATHDHYGTSCTLPQLAGTLGLQASAGGFRARLAPARVFGLAEFDKGA